MKKVLLTITIVICLMLGALVALPIIFKDSILEKVKTLINENVNAKVEFADFKLNVFRSFPRIHAELVGFSLIGLDDFEGDTIAAISSLSTEISLSELFSDEGLQISFIALNDAQVNLKVNKKGTANWDIMPITDEVADEVVETVKTETDDSASALSLQSVQVQNLSLTYLDETMPILLELNDINLDISGKMAGMITTFNIDGKVSELVVNYDSVNYISNVALALNSKLIADMDKFQFEFDDSKFYLNDLPINLTGGFAMPSDTMTFDVKMEVPQSNFATILALVPTDYKHYLDGVNAIGDAGFDGTIKGYMYGEDYPSMNFNIFVHDATMQYADMPEKIDNINLAANIYQPQGDLNKLVVNVSKAHAGVKSNPIDAQLLLKTPLSDMFFDAKMNAKINFATLKEAIPMDSVDLKGQMEGNIALSGTMSAVEKEDYNKINANGTINFNNFTFQSPDFTKPIELTRGAVKISNQTIDMNDFSAKVGQNDFTFNGKVSNYLGYAFMNQDLMGRFSLQSNLINLNELMSLMPETIDTNESNQTQTAEASSDSILIFEVPEKLDLTFNADVKKVVFDDMVIQHIKGLITVNEQKLWLKNLSMDMLDGSLTVDGSYAAYNLKEADFDFNFKIKQFTIPATYQSFSAMRHYVPIAKNSTGDISAQMALAGQLDEKLEPIAKSLNGSGGISTQNVQLAKTETIEKLNLVFKTEKLNNLNIKDFDANFSINNGNVLVKPFKTSIAGQQVKVYGEILVDQTLDLNLDFNVHKNDLNSDIAKVLNVIPGANKLDSYPIGLNIKGELSQPSVTPDLNEAKDLIADELKKSAKENANKVIDEVGNALKGLFGN